MTPAGSAHRVFDGHNDVLLRLWLASRKGTDPVPLFAEGGRSGHLDAVRARAGGMVGGLCAMFVPSPSSRMRRRSADGAYETPLAAPLERAPSLDAVLAMASIALRLDAAGAWTLCRTLADIEAAERAGRFAAVLHLEGCEPIGDDLDALNVFYAAGLRSLGPVWSRNNLFGHGVPFAFPASPDAGPGLTDTGRALVKACDRLGIMIDLSHLTERGFWDVAEVSDRPLVATHSNAHALSRVARNLTDRQLDAIRERRGVVGLNFACSMLREDGQDRSDTPLETMVRHIDHLVGRMGIDCVAIGSDFDGALIPSTIGDASGLQRLFAALVTAGYGSDDLDRIAHRNWMRVLADCWTG